MHSFVESIGGVGATFPERISDAVRRRAERSPVRCPDAALSAAMVRAIDEAAARGDSLGGVVRVDAEGVPPGSAATPSGTCASRGASPPR